MSELEIRNDNSAEVLSALERQGRAALEAVGIQAVSHAKKNITAASRVDTGALRNSISHLLAYDESAVFVGTNSSYAIYNEIGTGIYLEGGGGRTTPWKFKGKDGQYHWTRGLKPIHFLKRAIRDHMDEYKKIIEQKLKM